MERQITITYDPFDYATFGDLVSDINKKLHGTVTIMERKLPRSKEIKCGLLKYGQTYVVYKLHVVNRVEE